MNIDPLFLEAWVNGDNEHVILGRTLKPFCLLHLLALDQLGNPVVGSGAIILTDEQIMEFVAVCSAPSELGVNPARIFTLNAAQELATAFTIETRAVVVAKVKAYIDD